jgi:hypothetical protein
MLTLISNPSLSETVGQITIVLHATVGQITMVLHAANNMLTKIITRRKRDHAQKEKNEEELNLLLSYSYFQTVCMNDPLLFLMLWSLIFVSSLRPGSKSSV